jgi:hypothetical protein
MLHACMHACSCSPNPKQPALSHHPRMSVAPQPTTASSARSFAPQFRALTKLNPTMTCATQLSSTGQKATCKGRIAHAYKTGTAPTTRASCKTHADPQSLLKDSSSTMHKHTSGLRGHQVLGRPKP